MIPSPPQGNYWGGKFFPLKFLIFRIIMFHMKLVPRCSPQLIFYLQPPLGNGPKYRFAQICSAPSINADI